MAASGLAVGPCISEVLVPRPSTVGWPGGSAGLHPYRYGHRGPLWPLGIRGELQSG